MKFGDNRAEGNANERTHLLVGLVEVCDRSLHTSTNYTAQSNPQQHC